MSRGTRQGLDAPRLWVSDTEGLAQPGRALAPVKPLTVRISQASLAPAHSCPLLSWLRSATKSHPFPLPPLFLQTLAAFPDMLSSQGKDPTGRSCRLKDQAPSPLLAGVPPSLRVWEFTLSP